MDRKLLAYVQLTLAMTIVGSSVVVGKIVIAGFPVFLASGLRFAIASFILVFLLYKTEGGFAPLKRRDFFILFAQAFTGVFLFSIFLLYGLKHTSAISAGIITSTTPALIGAISFFILRERLSYDKFTGIGFVVAGIIFINMVGIASTGELDFESITGNLMVFGAVIGEALFTIFRKVLSKSVSALKTATLVSVFGFLMFLPFSLYEVKDFSFSGIPISEWGSIFYYGIVVTVIGFVLWFQGVEKVSGNTVAVFTGIMPISAIVLSCIILDEPILKPHILGVLFVLIGIYLSERNQNISKRDCPPKQSEVHFDFRKKSTER
jgi:drug/metabolite transporter (DMT)-like permease